MMNSTKLLSRGARVTTTGGRRRVPRGTLRSILPHFLPVRNDVREDSDNQDTNKDTKTEEGGRREKERRREDDWREIEPNVLRKGDVPEVMCEGRRENLASTDSNDGKHVKYATIKSKKEEEPGGRNPTPGLMTRALRSTSLNYGTDETSILIVMLISNREPTELGGLRGIAQPGLQRALTVVDGLALSPGFARVRPVRIPHSGAAQRALCAHFDGPAPISKQTPGTTSPTRSGWHRERSGTTSRAARHALCARANGLAPSSKQTPGTTSPTRSGWHRERRGTCVLT
ncbi:hypothetical protein NDU88_005213 [Pleurodeles waltl]|uniref:Uncharacterized protein n=1 Tax=Pleurodeles waltl TaxID=8319 RepID=A0AAV7NLV4_PLEWA|nr:hypothetical protein NDU88_005213 [Pleurodeles waltl]